jgi:protein-S-isoprenylcysteine O-methyltransferase Ste14
MVHGLAINVGDNTSMEVSSTESQRAALLRKVKAKVSIGMLILASVLFISAGRLDWLMGWIYMGLFLVCLTVSTYILIQTDPELVAERVQLRKGVKKWDIVLASLMAVFIPLGMLIVSGLDERYGWSPQIPLAFRITGVAVMVLGHLLVHWAMASNTFFSAVIRIQKDRGHRVVTTGPYQYVRHPGYVGAVLFFLPTPLILGSLWALIPAGLFLCITFIRTAIEDRTLKNELEGYNDYTNQVRYRLLPGVW